MTTSPADTPAATPLIWARPEPDAERLTPPLSRDQVVAALLRIADTEGVGAATSARLATELGPAAGSLAHHVQDQADLTDLLIDGVFGELELPEPHGDWQGELRTTALRLREAIQRHPWFAKLMYQRPLFGPNAMRWLDRSMAALEDAGVEITRAAAYAALVAGHVLGTALAGQEEDEMERTRAGGRTSHEWHDVVAPFLDAVIDSGEYPAFGRFLRAGAQHLSGEESFRAGLDAMLDGIALRVRAGS